MSPWDVLHRIIGHSELGGADEFNRSFQITTPKGKMLRSAVILATELEKSAIVVFTRSGLLARRLSALRPRRSPIYAFTDERVIFRQMLILWGVEPFFMEFSVDMEETVQNAMATLARKEWVQTGDSLVFITNVLAGERIVDTIQLRWVE